MRLHRLTIEAVGPFPGRHTIDIDALGASGLFLLEGPTGSGKTTIIDSIVFALYGDVADSGGSHRSRMHSQHAEPGVEPVVDLVLSTARGVYRIRRTPSFERPKQRGSGTTTVNPTARLWRLASDDLSGVPAGEDPPGEPVSAGVQEVGTELGSILGLTKEQFTQTVVLPQGQFARFLRAGVADRQQVLRQIFATSLYDDVQSLLADRAREARASTERAAQSAGRAASAVAEHARPGETERAALVAAAEAFDADGVEAIVGPLLARLTDERAAAGTAHEAARAADRAAQETLDTERQVARAIERRTALRAGRDELAAAAEDVARTRAALAAHAGARPVVVALDAADRAREALEGAAQGLDRRVREAREARDDEASRVEGRSRVADAPRGGEGGGDDPLGTSPVGSGLVDSVLVDAGLDTGAAADPDAEVDTDLAAHADRLEDERQRATAEQGRLSALVATEAGLAARRERLAATERSVGDLDRRLADRATVLAGLPEARAAIVERRATAQNAAAELSGARAATDDAETRLAAARLAERRRAELAAATEALDAARTTAEEAQGHENDLRARWRDQVAGRLARELTDGAPCPVCGSLDHPAPSPDSDSPVGEEDLAAAEESRAGADRALSAASSTRAAAEEQVRAAAEAAGDRSVDDATQALTAAREAVRLAEQQAAEVVRLDESLAAHDVRAAREAELRTADETERASLIAAIESLRAALTEDEEAVVAARGAHGSVADRAAALGTRAARARGLAEAVRTLLDRRRAAADTRDRAAADLAASELADAASARAAVLPDGERAAAERRVSHHEAETARVTAGLAETEIAGLAEDASADPAAAAAAREDAATVLEAAAAAHDAARRTLTSTTGAVETLRAELERHAARALADAPLVRVADLAAGRESRTGVTLATYVLLRRFEEVLAAANDRLASMSAGRYVLRRTDDREEGVRARAVGLGLEVLDTHTDAPRATRTLSGGETFYVSLALALGLADVVGAESGGIELGTLFVDEGFGTLDPETLDSVMNELGALRDHGRTVGLISHVAELKQRIPDQVTVRHRGDGRGSTLTVRAGD
ncbi:AAA family ATPase [Georgenia sp. Z1344]|uniref:AAA family ATPase n=1 Tax=Georgenia sp. Z1344 TaxID=3416706 RepID=UPI003CE9549C